MKKALALTALFMLVFAAVAYAGTLELPMDLESIGEEAFMGDTSLSNVVVPAGTTSIGTRAFADSSLATIHIPDSVNFIDPGAFSGTDATIVSSPKAYAHLFALKYNVRWADENPTEPDPLTSENYESFLLSAVEPIPTDGITDPDAIREIEAFNTQLPELNAQIDTFNENLAAAVENADQLLSFYGDISVSESADSINIRSALVNFDITGDGLGMLDEQMEVVSYQDDGSVTLRNGSGQLLYLTCSGQQMRISQTPRQALLAPAEDGQGGSGSLLDDYLDRELDDYLDRELDDVLDSMSQAVEIINTYGQRYDFSMSVAETALMAASKITFDAFDDLIWILDPSIKAHANILNGLMKTGAAVDATQKAINTVSSISILSMASVASGAYSAGSDVVKIAELNAISKHGHPTAGEMYDAAYEKCMELKDALFKAKAWYAGDIATNVAGIACTVVGTAVPVSLAPVSLVFGMAGLATTNCAERCYSKAMQLDSILHWAVSGVVKDEATKENLPYTVVTCTMSGYDDLQVVTDENGVYSIEPLSSAVTLKFQKAGYETEDNVPVMMARDVLAIKNVLLKAGTSGGLYGPVYDVISWELLPGAIVTANEYSATTNEEGYYTLPLPRGTYDITCTKDGYVPETITGISVGLDMDLFGLLLIPNDAPGWFGGSVKDLYREMPIQDVKITIGGVELYSDSYGNFSVELAPGTYTATYTHSDYREESKEIEIKPYDYSDGSAELIPMESSTITIYGRVYDQKTEDNIVNASVSCRDVETVTDEFGNYYLPVPVGVSHIVVSKDGYMTNSVSVPIVGNESLNVDIPLYPIPAERPETSAGIFEYREKNGGIEIVRYYGGHDDVVIPKTIDGKSVMYIGSFSFANSRVKSVVIPEGVIAIYDNAFSYCSELETAVLPSSLREIGRQAYISCKKLDSINIPNGVQTIEYQTFGFCISLHSIVIPRSVTKIMDYAFNNCDFHSIVIPQTVKTLISDAFSGCYSLKTVIAPEKYATKLHFPYANTINGAMVQ